MSKHAGSLGTGAVLCTAVGSSFLNRAEMRTLGRIGQPLSGGTYRPRRRLRAPRWLLVALGISLLAVVWLGVSANRQVGAEPGQSVAASAVPSRPGSDDASRSARTAAVFATVDGLELAMPHGRPQVLAFHEASRAEALELAPVGVLAGNDNPTSFTPPADTEGPAYRVLSSRGRARPATSAIDVAVPLGDAVAAPVNGTIRAVTEYPLYGRVRDWRVEITPEGRPDLTVVLIHLLRPTVDVGDTVTAGQTPIGVARLLPFASHVDYVMDQRHPHVHIEVKPASEAEPIDPNEPAQPAGD